MFYLRLLWHSSFQFCGCCILGFGIYFLVHNNFGALFHNLPSLTLGNVLVIVGSIIMVVAFLGCMGSIKENKCLLMSVSLSQERWCPKYVCVCVSGGGLYDLRSRQDVFWQLSYGHREISGAGDWHLRSISLAPA